MKLKATPLLEGTSALSFAISDLNPRRFVDLLDENKALLFTSDDDETPLTIEDFGQFVEDLKLEYYPYIGGAAPRTIIPVKASDKDIVFTANESPPNQPIPFHHELAQTPNPPEYIFFYCDVPPTSGGQTPLVDSTAVYRFAQDHHPDFIEKLRQFGIRYIRTLPPVTDPKSPIGRSYQQTWNVSSKDELEVKLGSIEGCFWEWEGENVRITSQALPGVRLETAHSIDGDENFIFQYTFANSIVAAYLGWQDCRNNRHDALRFGDDSRIDPTVLQSLADFMQQHRVLHTWKRGDIMALHNKLVMHSRNPFEGPRRILASIWGPSQLLRNNINDCSPLHDPLVFGFWKVPKDQCAEVCYKAIQAGYRRLDCACDYGNEVEVGQGIQQAINDGLCSRNDLFITSKLWNTYHKVEHVTLALDRTLHDLQLKYVDEYLIHFPISMEFVPFEKKYPPEWTNMDGEMVLVRNDMMATWKAMEGLVDEGKTHTIGVCNFSTQLLRQLFATCRIRPVTLQIELHPHNAQLNLVRFAHEEGMRVTAFSVLGASSYLSLDMATPNEVLMEDALIVRLAHLKAKTPAQILIRWALQRNTLPLCKTMSRMEENRNVFDFYLTGAEMKEISSLNKNRRFNDPGVFTLGMGTFCPIYE